MAVFPSNTLQTVKTYQRSSLALLLNMCALLSTSNTRFKNFNERQCNKGASVSFDLPPRFTTTAGLVASWQPAAERVLDLTVDQAANTSFAVTAQQRIFNLDNGEEDYMRIFGRSAMAELANTIEANIGLNAVSGVVSQLNGATHTESGPYRFYGDGTTTITSFQQLASMVMYFKNYGAVHDNIKVYLPDTIVPGIIGSGLSQFAPRRNDELAQSWEIGEFGTPAVHYYQSNLLPIHVSGSAGIAGQTLTVVSTNDSSGQDVSQITVSGATAGTTAVKAGDLFQFKDGVAGKPNMRFKTFIGHAESASPVQFRATADAVADGSGNVTITVTPALNWAGGANQNLNNAVSAGMQLLTFPSHRAGLIVGGDALYVAMPQLPEQTPYDTANEYDPDTGVSMRLTYGSVFGQNQTGMIYDNIWGSVLVPEYSMRILVPLSQG